MGSEMCIRDSDKLERTLGGIKDMAGLPNMIFVVDTVKEHLAIAEAKTLGIPVVAIVDSNSNPEDIAYPIPGNDDAIRAVNLYCELVGNAVLDGLQAEMVEAGVDIGASEDMPAAEEVGAAPDIDAPALEAEMTAAPEAAVQAAPEAAPEAPVEAAPATEEKPAS